MMEQLAEFVRQHPSLLVLTGAGLSEPSGIPVYRDKQGTWLRTKPIQHNEFLKSPQSRQRYWARSMVGWPRMAEAQPNAGHLALVELERAGFISQLITQNVDCLHQRAGHRAVIDMHGSLDRVRCLGCERLLPRALLQQSLQALNPDLQGHLAQMRPDGDADLADELIANVQIPDCPDCQGILKPDVVFFGGTIAGTVSAAVQEAVAQCSAVLVVGSSLTVFSGFRICRDAHRSGKPIAALNQGLMRADALIQLKVEEDCATGLTRLWELLRLPEQRLISAAPAK
jgi:NAD-dependent SIR2 family protein deacetylase